MITPYVDFIKANYDDNGNNCGGLSYQVSKDYECGVCGDSVGSPEPRRHEDGGAFGLKIVVGQYQAEVGTF